MKFTRTLSPAFIDALNEQYKSEKSWWRKIADDDEDVFILIRKNKVLVQTNGGLLIEIMQDRNENLNCKMFEEYLSLRSETPYIALDENTLAPIHRVKGLKGFVDHYSEIKQRISIFTEKEKQAVQYLANNVANVVDIEIGYEGELKENALKMSVPRIDMAAITDNGTLVFFEVKLFDNRAIRSKETPIVVDQLIKYKDWLAKCREDIVAGYEDQRNVYRKLEGSFFKKRVKCFDHISLYPNPRLIITDFDASQRDIMLPSILDGIKKGIEWMKESNDLIATGNHRNLARSNRLFLGLK